MKILIATFTVLIILVSFMLGFLTFGMFCQDLAAEIVVANRYQVRGTDMLEIVFKQKVLFMPVPRIERRVRLRIDSWEALSVVKWVHE